MQDEKFVIFTPLCAKNEIKKYYLLEKSYKHIPFILFPLKKSDVAINHDFPFVILALIITLLFILLLFRNRLIKSIPKFQNRRRSTVEAPIPLNSDQNNDSPPMYSTSYLPMQRCGSPYSDCIVIPKSEIPNGVVY
jgi:hypothetical protein